jgi:hypothetical protein
MAPRTVPLHEPAEARAMLHAEHQRVRALFQRYEHSRDPHLRRQIASQVCVALELQALLEDAGGVPAVADAPGQVDVPLGADGRAAHQPIQQGMRAVRGGDPHDVLCDVHVHDLMDAVAQHMEDAERLMPPHAAAQPG